MGKEKLLSRNTKPAVEIAESDRPPAGRIGYRWRIVAANYAVISLNYVDRTAIAVVAPLIIADLGLSKSAFGWVLTAFFLGYIPSCFYGGYWADRHGPRKVMAAAVTAWSVFVGLTAAGFNLVTLFIVRILFGAGEGPQTSVTTKTLSNWFPQRKMSTAVGITLSAQPIGGAIGAPLTVAVVAIFDGSWRAPFIVFGIIGLAFAAGWWAVVRDTPQQHRMVSLAEVQQMHEDEREQQEAHGVSDGSTLSPKTYIKKPIVLVTVLAYFGATWLFYTFLNWFPLFLSEAHGLDLAGAAFGAALPWIAGTIGMVLSGIITDAYAHRRGKDLFTARKRIFVLAVTIAAILVCFVGTAKTTFAAAGLMAIVLFMLYIALALPHSIIASVVPKQVYGGVSGFSVAFTNLAGLFSPLVIGYLLDGTDSWATVFALGAAIAFIPAAVLFLFRSAHGSQQPAA
jgi:ACS family hexuronate transporter-like MFS transporter